MNEKHKIELPITELATKDWTLKELMDTERRIEKAFHDQTIFLGQKIETLIRWFIGLIIAVVIAGFGLYFK